MWELFSLFFIKMEEYIQQQTSKIAKYILDIIMYDPTIPMSWALQNPMPVYTSGMPGLQFKVNGYIYHGEVQVLLNEGTDTFEIRLVYSDGTVKDSKADVYISELTDTIDRLIERTEDYEQRIQNDYPGLCGRTEPLNIVILEK